MLIFNGVTFDQKYFFNVIFKMTASSKSNLYQNAQNASYLPLNLALSPAREIKIWHSLF